jgi:hypothetical protein
MHYCDHGMPEELDEEFSSISGVTSTRAADAGKRSLPVADG